MNKKMINRKRGILFDKDSGDVLQDDIDILALAPKDQDDKFTKVYHALSTKLFYDKDFAGVALKVLIVLFERISTTNPEFYVEMHTLAAEMGYSREAISKAINLLVRKEILIRKRGIRTPIFFFNPNLVFKGKIGAKRELQREISGIKKQQDEQKTEQALADLHKAIEQNQTDLQKAINE